MSTAEYDYGNGSPGSPLRTTNTSYTQQGDANYLASNLVNLPASVIVTDSTYKCAETDYTLRHCQPYIHSESNGH